MGLRAAQPNRLGLAEKVKGSRHGTAPEPLIVSCMVAKVWLESTSGTEKLIWVKNLQQQSENRTAVDANAGELCGGIIACGYTHRSSQNREEPIAGSGSNWRQIRRIDDIRSQEARRGE